jgi:hypothetical protein
MYVPVIRFLFQEMRRRRNTGEIHSLILLDSLRLVAIVDLQMRAVGKIARRSSSRDFVREQVRRVGDALGSAAREIENANCGFDECTKL